MNKKGFTVSEIIIVGTLLVILATISFFAFTGYTRDARDAVRVADIKSMKSSIESYHFDNGGYPKPSNSMEITYSGAVVWEQGSFGDSVYKGIRVMNSMPIDPLFGNEYSYSVSNDNSQFELVGVLEGRAELGLNINQTNASSKIKAQAYTSGNFNGLLSKVSTGGIDYVLATPSITTNNTGSLDIVDIVDNKTLVYNNFSNLPITYKSSKYDVNGEFDFKPNNLVVFSGSLVDLENSTKQILFLEKLQYAYSGSILGKVDETVYNLQNLEIDIANPSPKAKLFACNTINFKLKYYVYCDGLDFITFYIVNVLNIDIMGIPGGKIYTIFRDSEGFYWFGTNEGAAYYDGSEWIVYQNDPSDSNSLVNNNVRAITQDLNGDYWIGTINGLSKLSSDLTTFTTYSNGDLLATHIQYIYTDENGTVWIGTNGGVASYSDSGVWNEYTKKDDGLAANNITALFTDHNGDTWFGTNSKGVDKFDTSSSNIINYQPSNTAGGMPSKYVSFVYEDSNNNMWIGTDAGLGKLKSNGNWITPYNTSNSPNGFHSDKVNYVYEDLNFNIWVGTDVGVGKLSNDGVTWTHYGVSDGINADKIISVYEDDTGHILILGEGGLNKIAPDGTILSF